MRRALALLLLALAVPAAVAEAREPQPGGELLVMNDGLKPVTAVRLRPAGGVEHAAWTGDLLAGEPIPVREGRRIDLSGLGLGCEIELELTVEGRAGPVAGQQSVCDEPRFWMAFALGLDEPGEGYAVRADEGEPAPRPPRRARTGAVRGAPDLNRGLPVCPGDPRCRKK